MDKTQQARIRTVLSSPKSPFLKSKTLSLCVRGPQISCRSKPLTLRILELALDSGRYEDGSLMAWDLRSTAAPLVRQRLHTEPGT